MAGSARIGRRRAPTSTIRGALPICLIALLASACSESGGDGDGGSLLVPLASGDDPSVQTPALPSEGVVVPPIMTTEVAQTPGTQPVVEQTPGTQPVIVPPPGTESTGTPPAGTQPTVVPPPGNQTSVEPPDEVTRPVVTPPTGTQPTVVPPPGGTGQEGTEQDDAEQEGTEQTVEPGLPLSSDEAGLASLFGRANFTWSYFDDAQRFGQDIGFGPGGLTEGDEGAVFLIADDPGNFLAFVCTNFQADGFFCISGLQTGERALFLFDLDADSGEGTGVFEYCAVETGDDACLDGLFTNPDGPLIVSIDPDGTAGASAARGSDLVTDDLRSWMTGLEQIDDGNAPAAPREGNASLAREMEGMTCAFQGRCL